MSRSVYKDLQLSPMFQLSLASKELFHSNFLAWIGSWDLDRGKDHPFRKLIKDLIGPDNHVDEWPETWYVAREFHSFDLCVLNRIPDEFTSEDANIDSNEDTGDEDGTQNDIAIKVYLVLENKMKSIPYYTQLQKYSDKVERINKSKGKESTYVDFILLSMSKSFPDKKSIDKMEPKWTIKSYEDLIKVIPTMVEDSYHRNIIEDYVAQLNKLIDLHNIWCPEESRFLKEKFLYFDTRKDCNKDKDIWKRDNYRFDYADLKQLRIHDLFQKQRYAMMCAILRDRFVRFGIKVSLDNDLRKDPDCNALIDFNYIHGEPLLDIWFKDESKLVYTIQVQADSYEHGFQWMEKISAIVFWESLKANNHIPGWMCSFNGDINVQDGFPIINQHSIFRDESVYPKVSAKRKNKKTGKVEVSYYGKYENQNSTFIYHTRKIKSEVSIKEVLDYIEADYEQLLRYLGKYN